MQDSEPIVPHRTLLTASVMLATLMQVLDSAIANVALPYMRGSLSANEDEVTWVLTSYVIAAAIMTAPAGWLAVRFGRKRLFIVCLTGFTVASMLCGAAQTLQQIVLFRVLQGMCGAALVPLSQAVMLDIYPFRQRAFAMAIFSSGVMMGPIMGPTLGGWLTAVYDWRWVFYVNLPLGILAMAGLMLFMPRAPIRPDLKFDWRGFAMLGIGIGALQMLLDRGQELDWFSSREIVVEAILAGLGLYLFVVHMCTAKRRFLDPGVFRDRNFMASATMAFFVATVMLASSALLAPYLEDLAGYPVFTAGIALAPRGLGTMIAMFIASKLADYIDQRAIMGFGLLVLGFSLESMSHWTPDVTEAQMMLTLVFQGAGIGFVFNPMTVVAYDTLPARLRGDGTALQALARNIGRAIGVSITTVALARGVQAAHADISAVITPFDRLLQNGSAAARLWNPHTARGAAALDAVINQQAQIIAYNNDFRLMAFAVVPPLLLCLLLRKPRPEAVAAE